jgi:hypothetical protein
MIGAGVLLPLWSYAVSIPQIHRMQSQPYESNREAFALTRGLHEPWNYSGPSKVKTCYLWRHIYLYDPRADRYVRDAATLRKLMVEADSPKGELYYVVGQRGFFAVAQKEVMDLLKDTTLFEKKAVLWAEEAIHTLEVYHYKVGSASAESNR